MKRKVFTKHKKQNVWKVSKHFERSTFDFLEEFNIACEELRERIQNRWRNISMSILIYEWAPLSLFQIAYWKDVAHSKHPLYWMCTENILILGPVLKKNIISCLKKFIKYLHSLVFYICVQRHSVRVEYGVRFIYIEWRKFQKPKWFWVFWFGFCFPQEYNSTESIWQFDCMDRNSWR